MGRPRKTLKQLVQDGTFLSRRREDRQLLAGELLPWPALASLQQQYSHAGSEPDQRALARAFEQLVRQAHAQAAQPRLTPALLAATLAQLGPSGSSEQLVAFFPRFLLNTAGPNRGPFTLERWQADFLHQFGSRDPHGRRRYRFGLLSLPTGNGKTTLAAGLALYELLSRPEPTEILLATASNAQAARCFRLLAAIVEQSPIGDWVSRSRRAFLSPASDSRLEIASAQAAPLAARAPTVVIVDDLHRFRSKHHHDHYDSLASGLVKDGDRYLLALSAAGEHPDSLTSQISETAQHWPRVGPDHDSCRTIAADERNHNLLWSYSAPADSNSDDPQIWRACNPASWISLETLRRQRHHPGLSEQAFRRLHLNDAATGNASNPDRSGA